MFDGKTRKTVANFRFHHSFAHRKLSVIRQFVISPNLGHLVVIRFGFRSKVNVF